MCCSLAPARFSDTTVLVAEAVDPTRPGGVVHLLGYENRARNDSLGPNAMVLPFPAAEPMGPENVLSSHVPPEDLRRYFKALRRAIRPEPTKRVVLRGAPAAAASKDVAQVFDSGSYTVVLSRSAEAVGEALERVPASRRPSLDPYFFRIYGRLYPGWTLALCCWSNHREIAAEPMLWWYVPAVPGWFHVPTLDAHDGRAPVVRSSASLDHAIVVGSNLTAGGSQVRFDDVPPEIRPFAPPRVKGFEWRDADGPTGNGDFAVRREEALVGAGAIPRRRVRPPGVDPESPWRDAL